MTGRFLAVERHGATVRFVLAGRTAFRPPEIRPRASALGTTERFEAAADATPTAGLLPSLRVTDGSGRTLRDGALAACTAVFADERRGGDGLVAALDVDTERPVASLERPRVVGVFTYGGVVHAPPGRLYLLEDLPLARGTALHAVDSTRVQPLGSALLEGSYVAHLSRRGTYLRVITSDDVYTRPVLTVLTERGGFAPAAEPYRFEPDLTLRDARAAGDSVEVTVDHIIVGSRVERLDLTDPARIRVHSRPAPEPTEDPYQRLVDDVAAGVIPEATGPGWRAARRYALAYVPRLRLAVLRSIETHELSGARCRRTPACYRSEHEYLQDVALAVVAGADGGLRRVGRFGGDPHIGQMFRLGDRLVAVSRGSVRILALPDLRVLGTLRWRPDGTRPLPYDRAT